jgi:hypothetical protein
MDIASLPVAFRSDDGTIDVTFPFLSSGILVPLFWCSLKDMD